VSRMLMCPNSTQCRHVDKRCKGPESTREPVHLKIKRAAGFLPGLPAFWLTVGSSKRVDQGMAQFQTREENGMEDSEIKWTPC
jgi:hypothetical protein